MSNRVVRGRVARISRGSVHDGPGVRTVVFLKGCPLRCCWCHSPETQAGPAEVWLLKDRCIACGACLTVCPRSAAGRDRNGPVIDRSRCTRCGRCADSCPTGAREIVGHLLDIDTVMDAVRRDVPFFDASSGGVTVSGGEPLAQAEFALALLERCRAEGIHTAIETCGHVSREALQRALQFAPLFLYDLKLADARRHQAATGVSNETIIENLRTIAAQGADIIVRFPLVPGVTDSNDNLKGIAALAASAGVRRIEVLPYHRAGLAKYARLNRPYGLTHVPACTPERAQSAAAVMRRFGVDARVGGSA